jgi:soluble lytic murein transglycosylase-like protein
MNQYAFWGCFVPFRTVPKTGMFEREDWMMFETPAHIVGLERLRTIFYVVATIAAVAGLWGTVPAMTGEAAHASPHTIAALETCTYGRGLAVAREALLVPGGARPARVEPQGYETLMAIARRGVRSRRRERAARRKARALHVHRLAGMYVVAARHAASATGVDVLVIAAVIRVESSARGGSVRSSAGALGPMQLMPATARALGVNPVVPRANILGGARYLARLHKRFGTWTLALAAYNAGPTSVARHGGIPPFAETRHYVKRVLRLAGLSPTPTHT